MIRFYQSHKNEFLLSYFFSFDYVYTKYYSLLFCNNSFDVKTIKFNRFHNRKTFLFHASFNLVWLKREIKNISFINYSWKKKLFYNISGAIHSNNISETLILLEYFRNMYPCHRRFRKHSWKLWSSVKFGVLAYVLLFYWTNIYQ